MNKYKTLALNTLIFTIGSFGSKVISLLLNNLYTKHISPSRLFTKQMLETLALFLIPVFTFAITEAVIRYGLDKRFKKEQVFSTSVFINLVGLAAMIPIVPLIHFVSFFNNVSGYTILLMLYIIASSSRAICSQFVRARELVGLFSFDGILTTLMLLTFNIIFISKMGLGVKGFMLSSILSDFCSAIFLFTVAKLRKYLRRKYISKKLAVSMLRFSLPLVPTTVMWTFTGFSDQLFIGNMHSEKVFLGESAAGLYIAASKLPNLVSMLSTIFMQAWNMSAITENESSDRNRFYTKVFSAYESVLFIGSAGLLLFIKPFSAALINYSIFPEYKTAYVYTPLLVAAAVFTCFDNFLASIYTATRHTINAFISILVVCIMNIILNFILIPLIGMQGAAIATFASYLLCFIIRMVDARRFVPFRFSASRIIVNTMLLLIVCANIILMPKGGIIINIILSVFLGIINFRPMIPTVERLIKR